MSSRKHLFIRRAMVTLIVWAFSVVALWAQTAGRPTNVNVNARQATPTITGLNPSSGAVGASVTISGTGFNASQGTSTVTFNGVAATVSSWGTLSLTVTVPIGATTGNVTVTVGTAASAGVAFTVTTGTLACTGATLNNPTASALQTRVNGAAANAVLCVTGAVGAGEIDIGAKNGISIVCPTFNCTAAASTTFVIQNTLTANVSNLMRIAGFTWTNGQGFNVWFWGAFDLANVRLDHLNFNGATAGNVMMFFGEGGSQGKIYGVVDHNTATGGVNFMLLKNISGGIGSAKWEVNQEGSSHNLFVEDNTCTFTSYPDTGTGCFDVWRANGTVFRFNDLTVSRFVSHSYCHEGPSNLEYYLNNVSNTPFNDFRNLHDQGGGQLIAWGNVMGNSGGGAMVIQHFRSDPSLVTNADPQQNEGQCNSLANGTTTGTGADAAHANDGNRPGQFGYPAWHQPGRDRDAVLKPIYLWNNRTPGGVRIDPSVDNQFTTWNGTAAACNSGTGLPNCHIQINRDIFFPTTLTLQTQNGAGGPFTPFTGTSGIGMGRLVDRPPTCTANAEPLDAGKGGVGYWATDQGTWNHSVSNSHGPQVNGASGQLFRCDVTNHWLLAYEPYQYPHPLVQ